MFDLRRLTPVLTAAALVACDQPTQELPFAVDEDREVQRTIDSAGGTLTNPAGLSISFPSNALSSSTEVRIRRGTGAGLDAAIPGTLIEGTAFEVAPTDLRLDSPARVSMFVPTAGLSPEEQLALSAAVVSDGEVGTLTVSTINLTSGILKARTERLGTMVARYADDLIMPGAGESGEGLDGGSLYASDDGIGYAGLTSSTYEATCEGSGCLERLGVIAAPEILERFGDRLGAIDLYGAVSLTFERDLASENTGVVSGSLSGSFELRLRTAGSVAGMGYGVSIDPPVGTRYEIEGNTIRFAGVTMHYRTFEADGESFLELELPPADIVLEGVNGSQTVRVALRVLLRRVE